MSVVIEKKTKKEKPVATFTDEEKQLAEKHLTENSYKAPGVRLNDWYKSLDKTLLPKAHFCAFRYVDRDGSESVRRAAVDSLLVHAKKKQRYLSGYCFLRGELRAFRLDRISSYLYSDSGSARVGTWWKQQTADNATILAPPPVPQKRYPGMEEAAEKYDTVICTKCGDEVPTVEYYYDGLVYAPCHCPCGEDLTMQRGKDVVSGCMGCLSIVVVFVGVVASAMCYLLISPLL